MAYPEILTDLTEFVSGGTTPLKVDREQGILYRVKVLGEQSLNQPPHNNVYPRPTRERVLPLMEGARSYANHAPPGREASTRPVQESLGVHRNLREEGDGVYSDFHFPPRHPLAEQIFWAAEHAPETLGFSIATRGRKVFRDGKQIVEAIEFDRACHSIDLVSRPATTHGLHESRQPVSATNPNDAVKTLREIVDGLPAQDKRARMLRALIEMDGDMGEMPVAAAEPAAAASPDEALKSGFRTAMVAAVEAFIAGEITLADLTAKIKDFGKMAEKAMGTGAAEAPADTGGSEESDSEDSAAEEAVRTLRAELEIRDLIEEAGLRFPKPEARKAFLKSLLPLGTDDRKLLIEERKAAQKGRSPDLTSQELTTPRSAPPGYLAGKGNGTLAEARQPGIPKPPQEAASKVPTDRKALANWLNAN